MQLLLTPLKGRRFTKHNFILAAEIFSISPAAYRMIRNSGAICLPNGKLLRQLLSRTSYDESLTLIFQELKPEQRFVNVLFGEVKLTSTLRYVGEHVIGHATNKLDDPSMVATSALVIEVICHHGGPRYIQGTSCC